MFKRLFQSERVEFDTGTVNALVKLALTTLTLALLALTTYGVPVLSRFRPWVPGETVPLARLFTHYDGSLLPSFAEAGVMAEPAPDIEQSQKAASSRSIASGKPPGPASKTRVAPEELEGLTQLIEDPEGQALSSFYAALSRTAFYSSLSRTANAEPKAVTRITHFGDSAVAADSITSTMRRLMQQRFNDAGHGFILVSPGDMHYYHLDIVHRAGGGWELFPLVLGTLGNDWYGYGGVQYRGASGAWARFATVNRGEVGKQVGRFEIFYQRYPGGGKLYVKLDGKQQETIDTRSARQEDGWHVVEAPDGPHSLSIKAGGSGAVRLYGVVLERNVPGVVYDSVGMVSGRAERFLSDDQAHIRGQISHRAPHLMILAFGGNEADNRWLDISRYEEKLRRVLSHIRTPGDKAACLLMGPLDQGERDGRGEIRTIPKIPEIVETQRRVARSEGCAFFDTYSAMGGKGSMLRWYRKRPRLATSDFRHATEAGYEVIGTIFYKAILKGYADYLERKQ